MVKLAGTFSRFQKINALVIGDLMLDKYTHGEIKRISPEAPVSVLKAEKEKMKSGGAGNVVLNILSLGANVTILGRIGDDLEGEILSNDLEQQNADVRYLYIQKNYNTPVKNRFIAANQQILRVDFEKIDPLDKDLEKRIIKDLKKIILNIDVVAISDYAKGFLSDALLKSIIDISNQNNIPVIVDPKGRDFKKYKNATIIKPNLLEAYTAANLSKSENIDKAADILLDQTNAKYLLITRSQDGMSVFEKSKRFDFPVISKEVKDVTGAGDTVLSMMSVAVANKIDIKTACRLSNIAASIVIEHLGCLAVDLSDLAKRLLKCDLNNKIFEESHLYALTKVLAGKDFSILGISGAYGLTTACFKTIKFLSLNGKRPLIIYLDHAKQNDEFIDILSSIHEVSFIILQQENLKNLYRQIHPSDVYILKDNKSIKLDNAKDLLETIIC